MTQSNDTFALRIVAIFVAIISSSFGFYVPFIRPEALSCDDISLSWMCLKAFSAGTILSVAVVHLLADAIETLSNLEVSDYPIALTLTVVGISITLGVEMCSLSLMTGINDKVSTNDDTKEVSLSVIENNINDDKNDDKNDENYHHHEHHHEHEHEHTCLEEHIHGHIIVADKNPTKAIVKSIILETCIALHSIIIGISLGGMDKQADSSSLRVLIVAYAFHQFFEGIVLGTGSLESKFDKKTSFWFWLVFVITVPIGIIIGMSTNSSDNSEIVSACANAIASGSLIYTSLVEMIAEDFMHSRVFYKQKLIISMYISFLLGFGLMALLANWA